MREALEKIRAAEERNEQAQKALITQLQEYERQKKQMLSTEEQANRQEIARIAEEREASEEQSLQAERTVLTADANALKESLEESYQKNATKLMDEIIERVKESYGRH